MSAIEKPPFILTYWNPFQDNSPGLIDSYINYVRDTSLQEYNAHITGNYILSASKNQIDAINEGFSFMSQSLGDIHQEIVNSNILLTEISKLLRLPDKEKERVLHIERGLKFFKQSSKDLDLAVDAKNEFESALKLFEQDWFVLQQLGTLLLYKKNILDINKSKEYFLKAAKYAIADADSDVLRSVNNYFRTEFSSSYLNSSHNNNSIFDFIRECYLNAAFCCYINTEYEEALSITKKALNFIENDSKLLFFSAKYALRVGNSDFALNQIKQMLDLSEVMAISIFGDNELSSNRDIVDYVNKFINDFEDKFSKIDERLSQIEKFIINDKIKEYLKKNDTKLFFDKASIYRKDLFLNTESLISQNVKLEDRELNSLSMDPLFNEAARIIVESQIASTSLIQKRLSLGYNRAGRLMDQLEAAGIVGPSNGSKVREVFYKNEEPLMNFLYSLSDDENILKTRSGYKVVDLIDKWDEIQSKYKPTVQKVAQPQNKKTEKSFFKRLFG